MDTRFRLTALMLMTARLAATAASSQDSLAALSTNSIPEVVSNIFEILSPVRIDNLREYLSTNDTFAADGIVQHVFSTDFSPYSLGGATQVIEKNNLAIWLARQSANYLDSSENRVRQARYLGNITVFLETNNVFERSLSSREARNFAAHASNAIYAYRLFDSDEMFSEIYCALTNGTIYVRTNAVPQWMQTLASDLTNSPFLEVRGVCLPFGRRADSEIGHVPILAEGQNHNRNTIFLISGFGFDGKPLASSATIAEEGFRLASICQGLLNGITGGRAIAFRPILLFPSGSETNQAVKAVSNHLFPFDGIIGNAEYIIDRLKISYQLLPMDD